MKFILVSGEDTSHSDDMPHKTYVVLANDEETARALVPASFRIDRTAVAKDFPEINFPPSILSVIEGRFRVFE